MCTALLLPGVNPIAVNKIYIISYNWTLLKVKLVERLVTESQVHNAIEASSSEREGQTEGHDRFLPRPFQSIP